MAERSADVRETVSPSWSVPPAEEPPRRSRLPAIAHAIVLVLGLTALIMLLWSLSVYLSSIESGEKLRLELVDLELMEDANPRAVLHLRLYNESPLTLNVQWYTCRLLLNDKWISSSDSIYRGSDPSFDTAAYARTFVLDDTLEPDQQLDLEFTVYIYPAQMDIVRQMQSADVRSWSAESVFWVLFAFTRDRQMVPLTATLER
jgi:hypothetical protein